VELPEVLQLKWFSMSVTRYSLLCLISSQNFSVLLSAFRNSSHKRTHTELSLLVGYLVKNQSIGQVMIPIPAAVNSFEMHLVFWSL